MTERSYHTFKASGQQFEIETKHVFVKPIGHGAYGVVISVMDRDAGKKVAIKKITRAFDDPIDAKRILREIKLMRVLAHENVIRILDLIPPPPTTEEFEDIYIMLDLMETDLHRIIYSKQPITIDHIQYFIYQILRGLKYIHSANVLHRDLKPSNLLLNSNCDLKICDFGLSRGLENEKAGDLTEYVVTRWYRAPEIMLACQEYTKAIDVWSVGCIFAELLARTPFFPGEDYIAQLRLITDKLGKPSDKDLDFVTSDRARKFMASLPVKKATPMQDFFPAYKDEVDALDLLKGMLTFHPEKRITVDAALEHPFLLTLHNPDDEPIADFTFSFEYENDELTSEKIQELVWDEVRAFHADLPEKVPVSGRKRSEKKPSGGIGPEVKAESKDSLEEKSSTPRKRSISPATSKECK